MEFADKAIDDPVEVTLNGKVYKVVPNFRMFCLFEKKTGKNPFATAHWLPPSPSNIVALVWAGIGGDESGMTIDDVEKSLTLKDSKMMNDVIMTLFRTTVVPDKLKKKDKTEKAKK
jgi:hypothetical protein